MPRKLNGMYKRGTVVDINAFKGTILNEAPGGYRLTITGRGKGNSFWIVLPFDLIVESTPSNGNDGTFT